MTLGPAPTISLPSSLPDWITVTILIIGNIVALTLVWSRLLNKINGFGGRVKAVESDCEKTGGRIQQIDRNQIVLRSEVTALQQHLGEIKKGISDVEDHLTDNKLEIIAHIHALRDGGMRDQMEIRERIATIEALMPEK